MGNKSIYDIKATSIDGKEIALADYKGQVMLIVNTASKCGFTGQYEGLQKLHQEYREKGLSILGFPCNQFGSQEPGSDEEVKSFCQKNYGVDFQMFSKVEVNGDGAHPLFKLVTDEAPGALNTKAIKWNFTKFLVDRNGQILKRFAPNVKPEELDEEIKKLLY